MGSISGFLVCEAVFLPILVGCVTAILYLAYEYFAFYISRRDFIQSQGCRAPSALPHRDPLFGLDAVRDTICAVKEKRSIARQIELYAQYGSTFSSKFFTTPVISTTEPEDIKTGAIIAFRGLRYRLKTEECFLLLFWAGAFSRLICKFVCKA